jgi:methionyl-tRNA synthetase
MDFNLLVQQNWGWLVLLAIWSLAWKGWALWIAARREQKVWFVALLILNTIGILEIFYIFYFSKQPKTVAVKK